MSIEDLACPLYFSKDADDNNICPICLDVLCNPENTRGGYITHSLCGHVYHNKCIMGWLQCHYQATGGTEAAKCPVCKCPTSTLFSYKTVSRTSKFVTDVATWFIACMMLFTAFSLGAFCMVVIMGG